MEKRLLIVDDNKEIIEIVTAVLEHLFDKVESATTVESAIELINAHCYAFVVLDINLEGRNGAEVIKYLVESPENPNKSAPFIIISGIVTPQFIERHHSKFAGILMKPFVHDDLLKIATEILNGKNEVIAKPFYEGASVEEIPYLKCELPFPILQLEVRVNKIMDQVRKNIKMKQLFSKMVIDRSVDNYMLNHIGMLINISTAISSLMEWNTDKTLEKFVYAAYLHDMALSNRSDLARISTFETLEVLKDKLSPVDYKLVFEHPNIAANSIEDLSEIPADVAMIVRQHHELPKETGFPSRCGFTKIPPLSVIFIIAHDLAAYILANPNWKMDEYIKKSRSKFKGAHFTKVLHTLSEIH